MGAVVCLGLPSTGPLDARPARPAGRLHSTLYRLGELRSRFCGHPVGTQDLGLQQHPSCEPSCCLLGLLPPAHQHRLQRKHIPWVKSLGSRLSAWWRPGGWRGSGDQSPPIPSQQPLDVCGGRLHTYPQGRGKSTWDG